MKVDVVRELLSRVSTALTSLKSKGNLLEDVALDDIVALVELRGMGLLSRPKFRPTWLDRWSTLLSFFAFASFLDEIELTPVAPASTIRSR